MQSLHICAYFGTENKETPPSLTYYDYFASENNDYFYFRNAIMDLTARPEFQDKCISQFWSDGGPKHFKTKRAVLFATVELPLRRNWTKWPVWNFFISHHGKSLCDAHASHCKSLFRRLAIAGHSLSGASDYVDLLNAPEKWRKSKQERDALFRYRDEPVPIVATLLCDITRTMDYDWEELISVRVYHCWRCTGNTKEVHGVTAYEVASSALTNSEMEDLEYAVPKYDLMSGRPYSAASSAPTRDRAQKRRAPQRCRRRRKGATRAHAGSDTEADSSASENKIDCENAFEEVEVDASMLEAVKYPNRLRLHNLGVAVLRSDPSGREMWIRGRIKSWKVIPLSKKVHSSDFQTVFRVALQGNAQSSAAENVIFGDNIRVLRDS